MYQRGKAQKGCLNHAVHRGMRAQNVPATVAKQSFLDGNCSRGIHTPRSIARGSELAVGLGSGTGTR